MKIPHRVRVKSRVYYSVVWAEVIGNDPEILGLCDSGSRIITIRAGQSQTETIKTFIHELLHAIEFEYEIPIPHKVIERLESGLFAVLKLNGLLPKDKSRRNSLVAPSNE